MKKPLLIAVTLLAACSGCNRSDWRPDLTRVASTVTRKVEELLPERSPLTGSFGLGDVDLGNRVRDRFKFYRYLAPLAIEIDANDSLVRLRGSVVDAVLKQRAIEFAESTVGVEKVVDEIVVAK